MSWRNLRSDQTKEDSMLNKPWSELTRKEKAAVRNVIAWAIMAQEANFASTPEQDINVLKSAADKLRVKLLPPYEPER
jgi:hypothetical protein